MVNENIADVINSLIRELEAVSKANFLDLNKVSLVKSQNTETGCEIEVSLGGDFYVSGFHYEFKLYLTNFYNHNYFRFDKLLFSFPLELDDKIISKFFKGLKDNRFRTFTKVEDNKSNCYSSEFIDSNLLNLQSFVEEVQTLENKLHEIPGKAQFEDKQLVIIRELQRLVRANFIGNVVDEEDFTTVNQKDGFRVLGNEDGVSHIELKLDLSTIKTAFSMVFSIEILSNGRLAIVNVIFEFESKTDRDERERIMNTLDSLNNTFKVFEDRTITSKCIYKSMPEMKKITFRNSELLIDYLNKIKSKIEKVKV